MANSSLSGNDRPLAYVVRCLSCPGVTDRLGRPFIVGRPYFVFNQGSQVRVFARVFNNGGWTDRGVVMSRETMDKHFSFPFFAN